MNKVNKLMTQTTISFIGGGNMARSLIGGLIADGRDANSIWVSDANKEQLATLSAGLAVHTTTSNIEAIKNADVIILAIKPQILPLVAEELKEATMGRPVLFLSVAAGIREPDINRWLGGQAAIVRTMPNTPALIQTGATALYANKYVSEAQRNQAETIMRAVGLALWVEDEKQMDIVTALSGSGPAYFFLMMESLEQAATEMGLPKQTARLLALQTGFGASKMALEASDELSELRRCVTSPGGTTERAVNSLEDNGIRELFANALKAAKTRSEELAQQFGDNSQ